VYTAQSFVSHLIIFTGKSNNVTISGILADFGVNSVHFDDGDRGFSFKSNGPLDMRFNQVLQQIAVLVIVVWCVASLIVFCGCAQTDSQAITAKDLVNGLTEADLARIFRKFGEERHANRAACAIVTQRAEKLFETTGNTMKAMKWVHSHPFSGFAFLVSQRSLRTV
jgi:16S rRNA (cytosine1402-N4)-methyltransferase